MVRASTRNKSGKICPGVKYPIFAKEPARQRLADQWTVYTMYSVKPAFHDTDILASKSRVSDVRM